MESFKTDFKEGIDADIMGTHTINLASTKHMDTSPAHGESKYAASTENYSKHASMVTMRTMCLLDI